MKKRFLSGLLALALTVGTVLAAFPALIVNAETKPIESYSVADEMRKAAADGTTLNATVSNNQFGAFIHYVNQYNAIFGDTKFSSSGNYYQAKATQNGTAYNSYVAVGDSAKGYLGYGYRVAYIGGPYYLETTFVAPKDGTYRFTPKAWADGETASVSNTSATFGATITITIKGEAQVMDGASATELTLSTNATADLPEITDIELSAGDTIIVRAAPTKVNLNHTEDWLPDGHLLLNYSIDMVKESLNLSEARYSYNLGDELRNVLSQTAKLESTNLPLNKFGPYTMSAMRLNADGTPRLDSKGNPISWSTLASGNVLTESGEYRVDIKTDYDQSRIAVATDASKFAGYALLKKNYYPMSLTATFTAPETSTYKFIPKSVYIGKSESVYNTYSGDIEVIIRINGEEQKIDGENTKLVVAAGKSADLPAINDIKLNAGETIEVEVKVLTDKIGWGTSYAYINYDIGIVETTDQSLWFGGLELTDNSADAGGEEVSVDLKVTDLMQSAAGAFAVINYEPNVFEFVRAESVNPGFDLEALASNGVLNIVASSDENVIGNYILARLYFKVKDGIAPADYKITPKSLKLLRINDSDPSLIDEIVIGNFKAKEGIITVKPCDHIWEATGKVETEATCLNNAVIEQICTKCDITRIAEEELSKLGHDFTNGYKGYTPPSCTEDGNEEHYHCSRCELNFLDDGAFTTNELENVVIPAEHQMWYTPIEGGKHQMQCQAMNCTEVDPTTVEDCDLEYSHMRNSEKHRISCDKCFRSETAFCTKENETVVTAPSWREPGEKTSSCTFCEYEYTEVIPPATIKSVTIKEGCTYKNIYNVGADFDYSGMVFVVTYNETGVGYDPVEIKAEDLSDTEIIISSFDSATEGTKTAELTVLGETVAVTGIKVTDRVPGDADEDGQVTILDAQYILWHIAYPGDSNYDISETNADVDGDGQVTILDAQLILWHIAYPGDPNYDLQ